MNLETFGVALILGWLSGAIFAARLISKNGGKVSLPYRDADQIAEAKEALRQGTSPEYVAGFMRVTVEELNQLLGLPVNLAANMVLDDPDYLWRADKLNEVL